MVIQSSAKVRQQDRPFLVSRSFVSAALKGRTFRSGLAKPPNNFHPICSLTTYLSKIVEPEYCFSPFLSVPIIVHVTDQFVNTCRRELEQAFSTLSAFPGCRLVGRSGRGFDQSHLNNSVPEAEHG
jgi:hypothetical protein